MKFQALIFTILFTASLLNAQSIAPKLQGVGNVNHAISTRNAEAQVFFNQGLALVYGFNHDEAARSFEHAAKLDPNLAMAWWGLALTQGSNYNLPSIPEREKAAAEAIQKAVALIGKASPAEQDYIKALAVRYTADEKADRAVLAKNYADAMRSLSQKYPDDLDAATLYAESMMNLRPWTLWNVDGTPAPGTEEIVSTLESVLKRDPNHVGANHYYIHAVEASWTSHRALPSADRLTALAPAAGHLTHMPSHIYTRVGEHDLAARSNEAAAKADEAYIARTKARGIYPMMYYSHNLHFLAYAYSMDGRFAEAQRAAERLEKHAAPHVKMMPMLEGFLTIPSDVLVRFQHWDDVLKQAQPAKELPLKRSNWHFARGMAYAAKGKLDQARAEHEALKATTNEVPAELVIMQNKARTILSIADHVLAGRIAREAKNYAVAEEHLKAGITVQDNLIYIEPPEWFSPVREELGGMYLAAGKFAEAEQTFREDLERNPRNGRSLHGLLQALNAQQKTESARQVQQQLNAAWKLADTKLLASN